MSCSKLLLFSIITAVTRAAGIFSWYFQASLPSRVTATACRKQRLYTPFYWNRERLSQPLSNFIFLWLMLSTRYLYSVSRARAQWECLHCTCALHYTLLGHPLPITHWTHFLITWLPFGQSPTPALSEHTTVKEGKIAFFSSVFSWKSVSCVVIGPFLKIKLFCKYYACRKDQNPLFFPPLIFGNFNMQPAECFFCK